MGEEISGGGHRDDGELSFHVLGPVRAVRGGVELATGSPQQRSLLAALLLRDGRTATVRELVDALWGDAPPEHAVATIRTYASRLRKALGAGTLTSRAGGYAAVRAPGSLDAERAQALGAEAERAAADGDLARGRALYAEALALWDGESLAGAPGPYAETQRVRLAELRLTLLEHRVRLELEAGCHADAIAELTALSAAHPLRERLRELLMLALYRNGRQSEALAVYADTRRLLRGELGVDPRPELSELQARILRADRTLTAPAPPSAPATERTFVRPSQLPASVSDFTGRMAYVDDLSKQLSTTGGSVMAVSSVSGIGGVGKTTLAVHVAHAARESFPDGQLYVDLQGSGPSPAEPGTVLAAFLRALGAQDAEIPDGLSERAALYRSTLAGRRVLALLDNARDAAQVRPLLPGTQGCAALITSRGRMPDLAGAHHVDLDVMSPVEAMELFVRIVGEDRVAPEREAAMDVVGRCGYLPLAIRIAASRLAARRTWTVSTLAAKLADEHRRLDELRVGDLAVKATFELGYGQLPPAQARAFRLLSLADGPDISVHAAAAMLVLDPDAAEDVLEALVDASLLESTAPGRYRYHDLVRLYARECAERDEQPPTERTAALSRLLDFYLATTAGVYALSRPGDPLLAHIGPLAASTLRVEDGSLSQEWLFVEADCVLATARRHTAGASLGRAVDLLLAAVDLAESGVYSQQFNQVATLALEAARQEGDARAEGRAHTVLTFAHTFSGRFEEADRHATRAMLLGQACGDVFVCSRAANDRGAVNTVLGNYPTAESCLQIALNAFRTDGSLSGEASALSNLSRIHARTGRQESAIQLAEKAVALYRELGASLQTANALYALGIALTGAGRAESAVQRLSEAVETFREHRMRLWQAMALLRMAEAHLVGEAPAQAAALADEAFARLHGIGGDWYSANVLVVLGRALEQIGQHGRAQACWSQALALYEQTGSDEAASVRALMSPTPAL
ncbi:BTAD domain-containing putative transcriptional regulator [Streptomyces polyrhachis]|uniref:BTAD domain-containing putative transcriptional regulator n=1 Tax=Streptomyces polyrhachis TaxID=1282885 RepID=A0ABW2GEW1_9ACTN